MRHSFSLNKLFLIPLFALSFLSLFAQNTAEIHLKGSMMRAPLEVQKGEDRVRLTGLVPGNTYSVKTSRAAMGQPITFELSLDAFEGAEEVAFLTSKKTSLRFKARSEVATFGVKTQTVQQVSTIPMMVSVRCESCETQSPVKNTLAESLALLQVQPSVSADKLIRNTLIGGDCFSISNVTSSGNPTAIGKFFKGGTNIGIDSGMVMSTGSISILPGPNSSGAADGGFDVEGYDSDLAELVSGDFYDINIIEFDFTPTANTVKFDFVFGSEEYCEFVGQEYNDVFGFFISGPGITGVKNIALIPNSNAPVAINNVNHQTNSAYYINNNFNPLSCFTLTTINQECELDGWTKPFTAQTTVIPCATYHIKLAIADLVDEMYDSAVFLRANSFNAGGTVAASPAYQEDLNSAFEGCGQGAIRFERATGDVSQPITVNFTISPASTATEGVDFAPLQSPVIIPAGQHEVFLPVNVFADGLVEGPETIVLLIDNSCECLQSEVVFSISDTLLFTAEIQSDTSICESKSATLSVAAGGMAPFSYLWSSGETTEAITVSPALTTNYSVTVTDACGGTATDEATVEVIPFFRNTVNASFCQGGSVTVNFVLYTNDTIVRDTSYDIFACGRITTYNITENPPIEGQDTFRFCAGTFVEIGGVLYNEAGTVVDTLSTAAGCDSIVTYTLVILPRSLGQDTIRFCPGDSVQIAGQFYFEADTVLETLTASNGCDSIVTHILELLPQPERSETLSFCEGDSVILGGVSYTEPGLVTLSLPATSGCDTLVTYKLEFLLPPVRTETIRFCVGDTIILGGTAYTQPSTVTITLPATTGCDTVATYTLQYLTPAPSTLGITCPNTVSVNVAAGATSAVATFAEPTATTDCPCPGIDITQISGLSSGSVFPLGISQVCFRAENVCGQTQSCCFNVRVEEENPCDTKVIGCMKYELLTITQDAKKNKTYRIRVTNNCANQLVYTAIQLPSGMVAMEPDNNSVYTAPSGNEYVIRNPNFSPFYSVRYRAQNGGIANGESDILRYTLPAQADVLFIDITTRLSIETFYEAHLNTFYCPVGTTPIPKEERGEEKFTEDFRPIVLFPNPTEGSINVDMAAWDGQQVQLQVLNSQGQRVLHNTLMATQEAQRIELPQGLADGLYFLEVATEAGEKEVIKFVVKH